MYRGQIASVDSVSIAHGIVVYMRSDSVGCRQLCYIVSSMLCAHAEHPLCRIKREFLVVS